MRAPSPGLTLSTPFVAAVSLPSSQVGLSYICATAERFFAVGAVLSSMVTGLAEQPSVRLLKHIIRCYLRLRWVTGARRMVLSAAKRPPVQCFAAVV